MNYQIIQNFLYFSSKENMEINSNPDFLNLINEKDWLLTNYNITQLLVKFEQPISIKYDIQKNEPGKKLIEKKYKNRK